MTQTKALLQCAIQHRHITTKESLRYETNSAPEIIDILKNRYSVPEEAVLQLLHDSLELPIVSVDNLVPDPGLLAKWPAKQLQDATTIPLYEDTNEICLVTNNPFHPIIAQIEKDRKKKAKLFLADWQSISKYWLSVTVTTQSKNLLDLVIEKGVAHQATDIHVYQTQTGCTIKYRYHGHLYPLMTLASEPSKDLTRLIKYHANMDISQWTQPQDGRINTIVNAKTIDIRAASVPSAFGEDFALRLMNPNTSFKTLENLGLSQPAYKLIKNIVTQPWGLILITGPTGSGKTTTLYSCLRHLGKSGKHNIVTIEDPIEIQLPGIRQTQINTASGYTFDSALRSILRHDPDIIMVGEIRDAQTAKTALQAAYTGHLVFASLHTPNCESTFLRLSHFDLDPFLIAHSLKAVISQKLHQIECPDCQNEPQTGCPKCKFTGLSRRELLTEILQVKTPSFHKDPAIQMDTFLKNNPYYSFEDDFATKKIPCGTPPKP